MSLAPASRRTRKFAKARSRPGRQAANQRQGQQERFAFVYSLSITVHFLCGHAPVRRKLASYVDRILKGAKAGDLPIEQANEFHLVVNLRTAKHFGITIPESILVRADEVIR